MITPTGMTQAAYTEAILSGVPQHVRMTFDNGVVLGDQDIEANGLTLMDILNGDTDLTFGKAVCKELSLNLLSSSRLDGVRWNHEFTLEMGIDVTENNQTVTKWVQVGIFQGTRPDKIHYVDVIAFTGHDRMVRFDVDIDPYLNGLTWPVSFSDLLEGLCDYCGVEYVAGDELQNIMSRTFENTLSGKGLTGVSLLAAMAEACGCYAKITPEGKLRMTWFSEAAYEVDADHEFAVDAYDIGSGMTWAELGEYTWEEAEQWTWADVGGYNVAFAVHGLSSKMSETDVGVNYGDLTGNIYLIVDNPFLVIIDDTDKDNYVRPLYERLAEFGGYLPVNVECVGNWLVEAGDIITVDVHGDSVSMPVFCRTMVWNGSCSDSYEATGSLQRQAVSAENRQKLTDGGRFHEFRVELEELFSAIQDAEGNISTLQQTAEQIVLSLADKYDKVSGITITAAGIDVSGSQYVKIASGGTFEVESTNFSISSTDERMIAGNWQFDSEGVVFTNSDGTNTRFVIGNDFSVLDSNYNNTGLIFQYREWGTDGYMPTIWFFQKTTSAPKGVPLKFSGSTVYLGTPSSSSEPYQATFNVIANYVLAESYVGTNILRTLGNDCTIGESGSYGGYFRNAYIIDATVTNLLPVVFQSSGYTESSIGSSSSRFAGAYFNKVDVLTWTIFNNTITGSVRAFTIDQQYGTITDTISGSKFGIQIYNGNVLPVDERDTQRISFGKSDTLWPYGYFDTLFANTIYVYSTGNNGLKLYSGGTNSRITRTVTGNDKGLLINIDGNILSYASNGAEPTLGTSTYRWNYGYFTYLDTSYTVSASSKNVKHDIRLMNDIGDKLDRLRPVTFVYNRDDQNRKRYGLIWEEAVNVLPDICIGGDDGADESKAINYVDLIPMLLREIQGLRRRVKDLEVMIA